MAGLLEQAANDALGPVPETYDSARLKKFLAHMAQFSDQIPDLPDEALSRASIYRDHD